MSIAGLNVPGLFRVPGDTIRIKSLTEEFSLSPEFGNELDLTSEPIYNISSLLKTYLRHLPCAIFDQRLLHLLCNTVTSEDLSTQSKCEIISDRPQVASP